MSEDNRELMLPRNRLPEPPAKLDRKMSRTKGPGSVARMAARSRVSHQWEGLRFTSRQFGNWARGEEDPWHCFKVFQELRRVGLLKRIGKVAASSTLWEYLEPDVKEGG